MKFKITKADLLQRSMHLIYLLFSVNLLVGLFVASIAIVPSLATYASEMAAKDARFAYLFPWALLTMWSAIGYLGHKLLVERR